MDGCETRRVSGCGPGPAGWQRVNSYNPRPLDGITSNRRLGRKSGKKRQTEASRQIIHVFHDCNRLVPVIIRPKRKRRPASAAANRRPPADLSSLPSPITPPPSSERSLKLPTTINQSTTNQPAGFATAKTKTVSHTPFTSARTTASRSPFSMSDQPRTPSVNARSRTRWLTHAT